MSIDSINAQNVTGVLFNNESFHGNNVSINDVTANISNSISKAINRAGSDVVKKDAKGATYTFTPYYNSDGKKMVMIQIDSSKGQGSTCISRKSIPFEMLEKFCKGKNIDTPVLNYKK